MKRLFLDLINVSEMRAISASKFIGKNNPEALDQAAVENIY
jgi:fructose-1,6-bisphosphatase/sedoheptulose 1,7-bisphosphatase-like protein